MVSDDVISACCEEDDADSEIILTYLEASEHFSS